MANIVLTKNAMNKLRALNLSRQTIYDTVSNADKIIPGREEDVSLYEKGWAYGSVTVIAKKIEGGKLLIISLSARYKTTQSQPKPEDPRYKNASFLRRIFLDISKLFGL